MTAAPQLPPATLGLPGTGVRQEYEIKVTDMVSLCRAIGEGKVPTEAVTVNLSWLKIEARKLNGLYDYPGVRATPVEKIRVLKEE